MIAASFPRVTLPDVTPEARELVAALVGQANAEAETLHRNRVGMAQAMARLGRRPYLGHVWREPKATKNVRLKARLALRSTKGASA